MKDRHKKLKPWLAQVLVDEDVIANNRGKKPVDVYSDLSSIFLKEVQIAFKEIIKEYTEL